MEGPRTQDAFDRLYASADGDPGAVPWARLAPSPLLLGWLDQPGLDVSGSDVLVVGCGLGDDAAELARRGCRVTAFDLSATAVDWARDRFADLGVTWDVGDLLDLPSSYTQSFGLVVEVRTIQSLPEDLRPAALAAVAGTVAPGGVLVHAGLMATSPRSAKQWEGPPWALSPDELRAYEAAGLERLSLAHPDAGDDPAMEVVLTLQRPE
jgi:SAM-dependent methyltransferase